MRILIVRHGEPNYEIDSLTNKGFKEANALSKRLLKEKIDYVYLSPLGRAQDTAKKYLKMSKKNYIICDWLQEFPYTILDENTNKQRIPWDFPVEYFSSIEHATDNNYYLENNLIKNSKVYEGYKYVVSQFDSLLAKHGYVRYKDYYKVENSNKDTLIFFCHLGLECVLLSHLFNIPFWVLTQHVALAPSSLTIIYSEERKPTIAQFRAQCIGDLSHLYASKQKPSFMGRFRENYFDNTRSD